MFNIACTALNLQRGVGLLDLSWLFQTLRPGEGILGDELALSIGRFIYSMPTALPATIKRPIQSKDHLYSMFLLDNLQSQNTSIVAELHGHLARVCLAHTDIQLLLLTRLSSERALALPFVCLLVSTPTGTARCSAYLHPFTLF